MTTYEYIVAFWRANDYAPTIMDIARALGRPRDSVRLEILKLQKIGAVEYTPRK